MFSPGLTTINWIQSLPGEKVSKYQPGPGWGAAENVTIKVQNSGYNLHNIGIILSSGDEWDNVFNPHPWEQERFYVSNQNKIDFLMHLVLLCGNNLIPVSFCVTSRSCQVISESDPPLKQTPIPALLNSWYGSSHCLGREGSTSSLINSLTRYCQQNGLMQLFNWFNI